MTLKTQHAASKIRHAPSKPYLSKMCHSDNRPNYFYDDGDSIKIDIDHPDWIEMLEARAIADQTGSQRGKPNEQKLREVYKKSSKIIKKDIQPKKEKKAPAIIESYDEGEQEYNSDNIEDLFKESKQAKMKQDILKAQQLEYKNEKERLSLEKESMNLITTEMAEYLFFGFLEKMNNDLLRLNQKISPKIVNLCNAKNSNGVMNLYQTQIEAIIRDTIDQQKKNIEAYKREFNR